jgi:uncharacterized Zn-binding protein involved in type VI secretion
MAAVALEGAICSGHQCWPPRNNTGASTDVKVNGKGVIRVGDPWNIHTCDESFHAGLVAAGSGSVFVNGRAVARIGDAINCGSIIAEGSTDVFVGGAGGGGGFSVEGLF